MASDPVSVSAVSDLIYAHHLQATCWHIHIASERDPKEEKGERKKEIEIGLLQGDQAMVV